MDIIDHGILVTDQYTGVSIVNYDSIISCNIKPEQSQRSSTTLLLDVTRHRRRRDLRDSMAPV